MPFVYFGKDGADFHCNYSPVTPGLPNYIVFYSCYFTTDYDVCFTSNEVVVVVVYIDVDCNDFVFYSASRSVCRLLLFALLTLTVYGDGATCADVPLYNSTDVK